MTGRKISPRGVVWNARARQKFRRAKWKNDRLFEGRDKRKARNLRKTLIKIKRRLLWDMILKVAP